MVLRRVALALSALFLVAADEPPPLPAALEAYVAEGRFKPGDFGWMRGRLADASEQDRESQHEERMREWLAKHRKAAKDQRRRQPVKPFLAEKRGHQRPPSPIWETRLPLSASNRKPALAGMRKEQASPCATGMDSGTTLRNEPAGVSTWIARSKPRLSTA